MKYEDMATKKLFTLVFLKRDQSVLLGFKTRGLGQGLWNGFGGKLEPNESVVNCAKREVEEECHLIPKDLKHIGVVKYDVENQNTAIVHIFTCYKFEGVENASEEMNPVKWYKYSDIPYMHMWPDSILWYPLMLENKFFSVHVVYTANHTIKKTVIGKYSCLSNALELAK